MAITNKGTKWEYAKSLYILWSFVPFLNWVAFLQIAIQARKPKWHWYSAVYGAINVVTLFLSGSVGGDTKHPFYNILYFAVFVWLFALPVGVAHAIRLRKEALIRFETIEQDQQFELEMFKREAQIEFGRLPKPAYPQEAPIDAPTTAPIAPISAPSFAARKVDINRASETEIAALAGLGPVLAKRAIDEREQRGPFSSIDAFGERLNVQPHIVERLRKVAMAEAVNESPAPQQGSGRVVDF